MRICAEAKTAKTINDNASLSVFIRTFYNYKAFKSKGDLCRQGVGRAEDYLSLPPKLL